MTLLLPLFVLIVVVSCCFVACLFTGVTTNAEKKKILEDREGDGRAFQGIRISAG